MSAEASGGGSFYLVAAKQTASFSYPVLAESAQAARDKVDSLIASGAVRAPSLLADGVASETACGDASDSSEAACGLAAGCLAASERDALLGAEMPVGRAPAPQEMARTAKSCLKRSGSGALSPSKRQRR